VSLPKARVCFEIGDTDDDGKIGITIEVHADIPFDGTSSMKQIIKTPELEPPIGDVPDLVKTAVEFARRIAGSVKR